MTSLPSTRIVPEDGSIRRLIIRMVVVLPQPDGPTRTTVSPPPISSERSPTAAPREPGNRLEAWRREIIACPSGVTSSGCTMRSGLGGLRLEGFEGVAARSTEVRGATQRGAERALHDGVGTAAERTASAFACQQGCDGDQDVTAFRS